jgi:hypothetical protein
MTIFTGLADNGRSMEEGTVKNNCWSLFTIKKSEFAKEQG